MRDLVVLFVHLVLTIALSIANIDGVTFETVEAGDVEAFLDQLREELV